MTGQTEPRSRQSWLLREPANSQGQEETGKRNLSPERFTCEKPRNPPVQGKSKNATLSPVSALACTRFRLAILFSRGDACRRGYFLHLRLTSCLYLPNGMEVTLSLVQGMTEKGLSVTIRHPARAENNANTTSIPFGHPPEPKTTRISETYRACEKVRCLPAKRNLVLARAGSRENSQTRKSGEKRKMLPYLHISSKYFIKINEYLLIILL